MNISIIVNTYNWSDALKIILDSLIPQIIRQRNHKIEIIIADDGSNEVTKNLINQFLINYGFIHHVWHEDIGFRRSMILNKAVAKSNGEYLIFLDGDCIPFPDYVEEQIFLIESGYMVAGNRVLLSEKITKNILQNPSILNNMLKWRLFNWLYARIRNYANKIWPNLRLGNGKWRYLRGTNWKYPKGCNFAIWRSDFLSVNGFDESFEGWGHEDSDLFVRLLHLGVRFKNGRFAIPVIHLWHKLASRNKVNNNWSIVISRANDPTIIFAPKGIDQYL